MLKRALQRRWFSSEAATSEIEDTLKVASLIHSFRNDGHLAAALDPLQRVRQGPWLAESRQATTWLVYACSVCKHHSHRLIATSLLQKLCALTTGATASLAQLCTICNWQNQLRSTHSKWQPSWGCHCLLTMTGIHSMCHETS